MFFFFATWADWIASEAAARAVRVALTLLIGLPLIILAARAVARLATARISPHAGMLLSKAVYYTGIFVIIMTTLREFGWHLTAILGAAGIAGVAIGFASQTSLSNIISGLFLIWERPFHIGDTIEVGATSGTVDSIDLLSVKLRTLDNRFVRLPNEMLIKSNLINHSRFPIRRHDIPIAVASKEDARRVLRILTDAAASNPHCLKEPAPTIYLNGFNASSLNFVVGVWSSKEDSPVLRTSLIADIKTRFDAEGIEPR